MDGHSSHYNPSTIKIAAAQQVILFSLPPHTTHTTQPLDVSAFGVLKQRWDEQCQQYMAKKSGKVVTRFQFSELFPYAWAEAMVLPTICAGFKAAGVYPLDSAVFVARTAASDPNNSPLPSSSLKLVPMYSPIAPKNRRAQSLTQEESKTFNKGMMRDVTCQVTLNTSRGSIFIILMKLSVFVNLLLILLKNPRGHQLRRGCDP